MTKEVYILWTVFTRSTSTFNNTSTHCRSIFIDSSIAIIVTHKFSIRHVSCSLVYGYNMNKSSLFTYVANYCFFTPKSKEIQRLLRIILWPIQYFHGQEYSIQYLRLYETKHRFPQ